MNILFVNEVAGFVGGVEQNIVLSAQALTERGHTCHLLYSRQAGGATEFLRLFASSSDQLGGLGEGRFLSAVSPDVAYLHRVSRVMPFLGRPFRTVRMVHDHDLCCPRRHKYYALSHKVCTSAVGWRCWLDLAFLERREGRLGWQSLLAHKRELRAHQKLDQLLVGSQAMRLELLLNGFKEEQIQVLAPAVPLAVESAPAAEPPHGVLFVGQMVRGKGPDLLLRALALLDPSVKLTMVGEGNWLPHLKELAQKLGLAERITWKHRVSPHQLEALYRGAAVVAVPSRWAEPFGMVGLEAMQHARPVVAFAVGGIPDWLQDGVNGRLIRPPSIADFAGALRQILEDPRLAEAMGRRGLELARSRFSFAQYVARLESVLQPEPAKVAV